LQCFPNERPRWAGDCSLLPQARAGEVPRLETQRERGRCRLQAEVVQDEIHCDWHWLVLRDRTGDYAYVSVPSAGSPDIARQFGITEVGVKKHLQRVFAKLGAANRSEAVAIALKKQLLKI